MTDQPAPVDSDRAGQWSDHYDLSMRSESARAKVILSACYLEELTLQFVSILLKECSDKTDALFDGPTAPLSSFSSRIEMLWRMGAIDDKLKESLHLIRRIRNQFAHRIRDCSFDDQKIRGWNSRLN